MTDTSRDPRYDAARTAFDELKLEDKAAFVVESTVNTMADLFRQAAQQLGDLFQDVGARVQTEPKPHAEEPEVPPSAEPTDPTKRRRGPRPPASEGATGTI